MKLKGIKLEGTYKIIYYDTNFAVYDEKGNEIYFEDSNGFWEKREYNEQGKVIYFENSNGYWSKSEYDGRSNEICYENSYGYWFRSEYNGEGKRIYFENKNGEIVDKRVKELTIEQIEKILGYKIKIKGNESVDKNMNVEQEGADFYGATKYSEKADDILFALQVVFGQPKYTYRDFQKMNLSQTEINEALEYVEKKGYNKFSYFG